jgi:glutamine phosphoribosylpyrophosphate amidotransferase
VRDYLGCDTLAYLELDALMTATGAPRSGFCTACLTGNYPVEVPGLPTTRGHDDEDELPDAHLVGPRG